jgi:hypothetical protein
MRIRAFSTGASVVVLAVLFALAFGNFGQGRTTAASGSAPVTIVNTPVPITGTVALVPAQPFAIHGAGVTQDALFAADKFSVPAGKRLIVETVTISASVPPGDLASCGLTVSPAAPGDLVTHHFAVTPQGNAPTPFDQFVSTAPVRLYFGPNDELTWFCFRSNGSGFITFAWSISGYLVDV